MVWTMLRVIGGLLSLASLTVMLSARGPDGEPSVLERIPSVMDALKAQVAARETGTVTRSAPVLLRPSPHAAPSQAPDPAARVPDAGGPPRVDAPGPSSVPPSWRLPTGAPAVRVNRGLP
jgi:hypothetical protein